MFWWFNPFTWLIFFCVIGAAAYLIIKYELVVTRKGVRKKFETETKESALEILEKRLARGEITGEEFEMIKRKLEET
ncbi:MAG: hypothetical protein JETT_1932 [Candidatus Jettenia ecosi]|uniref:SHOCT domain-containing protein n=1 Tax=Candidatus Jettenia ecosi TaxID=2494326 RepID=A0A533QAN7_9BACT|nr:MAG: hypothetical protein JETT_1932 [Candidatus Jettenia ecosi]